MMQPEDYRIVLYRREYTAQILEVQKYLWGPDADMNAAYFDWKYVRNPYVKEPLIYLAVQGNRVVGMRGFVGAEWEFGSPTQSLVLPLASDLVIAPDHRSRGLLTLIMKAAMQDLARQGYTYVVSMAAMRVTLMNQLMTGWRSIDSLRPLDRIPEKPVAEMLFTPVRALLEKSSLAVSTVRKVRSLAGKMTSAPSRGSMEWFPEARNSTLDRHISVGKAARGAEMVNLKRRLTHDSRIRHVYSEEYYAWRFENPRNRYRCLFWDGAGLEGYLILQSPAFLTDQPLGILDWEASSDEVRTELLQAAIELAGNRTVSIWSATLRENECRVLEAAGFRERASSVDDPQAAAVRHVDDAMLTQEWRLGSQRLLDLADWDFRMIHSRAF